MLWSVLFATGSALFREVLENGGFEDSDQAETRLRRVGGFDKCMSTYDLSYFTEGKQIHDLSPEAILRIAAEVMTELEFFHKNRYAHGNIRPENILLECTPGEATSEPVCHARITDFTYMCDTRERGVFSDPVMHHCKAYTSFLHEGDGPFYLAPEFWAGARMSKSNDLWAFGVMLHQIIFKTHAAPIATFVQEYKAQPTSQYYKSEHEKTLLRRNKIIALREAMMKIENPTEVVDDAAKEAADKAFAAMTGQDSKALKHARTTVKISDNWPDAWKAKPEMIEVAKQLFKLLLAPRKSRFTNRSTRGAGTAARLLATLGPKFTLPEATEEHDLVCWTLHCSPKAYTALGKVSKCDNIKVEPGQEAARGPQRNPETEALVAHYQKAFADADAQREDD